jgi:hypothetical protein
LVYFKDPSIVCGKDFNSLSQKLGVRIELATKPKDGMANKFTTTKGVPVCQVISLNFE